MAYLGALQWAGSLKILQFWEKNGSFEIPEAASVTIFLIAILGINLCGVRTYGAFNNGFKGFFYVVSVLIVGLIVRYDDDRLIGDSSDPSTSPFIIAIQDAGLHGLDSVMNVVILVSVLSVANASFFASSRVLAALAEQGQAPNALRYIDRQGRPIAAVCLATLVGLLSYMGTGVATDTILDWLTSLSGLSSIMSWASICLAHIRFRQAWKLKGHSLDELVYRSPVGVAGSWLALVGLGLIVAVQVWVAIDPIDATQDLGARVEHFFSSLLTVPVVFLFYLAFKLTCKTKWVKIEEIDIETGRYKIKARHRRKEGGSSFLERLSRLAI
ncbi:hypothetical protein N0V82_000765 [Gnomoniopsis sp. IMI 355080]|nr:hypothetical protein N0V82_000765 [Gnomoniopsis sp. IMI 355080]